MQRDLLSICDISELLKRIYYIQPASSLQTILKHELYAERFVAHICDIALRGFILYKLFACWKMCVQQTYHPVLICTFLRYIFLCYLKKYSLFCSRPLYPQEVLKVLNLTYFPPETF